ncbi:amidohydrolase family protein [Pleomorphovibrio marinus]|uniref:amidohydrolase family protein n=1 Tax=Pleomorphovibrio marinus TaxID=2164132 RepID=UPI000E09E72F|nr:amidohydrolase family protein [Pleomorphovibrio marinus]
MRILPKIWLLILLALLPILGSAQIDGEVIKAEYGSFLLKGGNLVRVSDSNLEDTDLLIKNGKIEAIGKGLPEENARVIDCTGKYVYPGMIDAGSRLGLVEISSLEETQDFLELGEVTPNMQVITAVNPNAVAIPVTRVSGVTSSLAIPQGGLFPGTAALIHLHGYTPDQMFGGFKGILMNFPSTAKRGNYDKRSENTIKSEAKEQLDKIDAIWKKAETYHGIKSAGGSTDYYPEMEHLSKILAKEIPLIIEVNSAKDIKSCLEWIADKDIKVIFSGVAEGWRVADKIAEAKVPVLTGPILSLPTRESDAYDAVYANPGKMLKAGVKVAIRTNQQAENTRNLPYHAGFAAAYGMGREEALRAVTLSPAEIFGLDNLIGSLDEGKLANLFVSDGDPFETQTNITHVFIQGYKIPMTNRHIRLYQEFLERKPELLE